MRGHHAPDGRNPVAIDTPQMSTSVRSASGGAAHDDAVLDEHLDWE